MSAIELLENILFPGVISACKCDGWSPEILDIQHSRMRPMSSFISAERLSNLIGHIYDCALDPQLWPKAMDAICEELDLRTGVISLIDMTQGLPKLASTTGFSETWLQKLPEYSDGLVALWGGEAAVRNLPLEEPAVLSRVNPDAIDEKSEDPFHVGFNQPQGFIDAIAIGLTRDDAMLGTIGFNRHEQYGLIGPREIEVMRLLLPHLQRAVTVSRVLDMRRIETQVMKSALDTLDFPLFVIGSGFQSHFANGAAETLLAQSDFINHQGGRLRFGDGHVQRKIETAMHSLRNGGSAKGVNPFGTAFIDETQRPWVAHLLPLNNGIMNNARIADEGAFALLLSAPSRGDSSITLEALALLYDLTVTETRVFRLLCAGNPTRKIADELNIAQSTIKTHILRIYEKTGQHRQADLVALAGAAVPVRVV